MAPATVSASQHSLGAAQLGPYLAVARSRAALPLQRGELLRELLNHVINPQQVRLGGAQLQFGFMSALIQPGNTGGLFQYPPPCLGPCVDQLCNLPLAHKRG
jgi:hypothetical protein